MITNSAFKGICLLFLLTGCQTVLTPEQVTEAFWEAMAEGDLDKARSFTAKDSRHLVARQQNLEDANLQTGAVSIDGAHARVATVLTLKKTEKQQTLTFDTVLLKEDNRWLVDYQQTLNNVLNEPFARIFKSLSEIGEAIGKELEHQIPLFEKQLKYFSEELIRRLEEFRRELEKNLPPEKQDPPPGMI